MRDCAGWWAPALATLGVLQHMVQPPEFPAQEAINTTGIGLLTIMFGYLGVRALRMPDTAWVAPARP